MSYNKWLSVKIHQPFFLFRVRREQQLFYKTCRQCLNPVANILCAVQIFSAMGDLAEFCIFTEYLQMVLLTITHWRREFSPPHFSSHGCLSTSINVKNSLQSIVFFNNNGHYHSQCNLQFIIVAIVLTHAQNYELDKPTGQNKTGKERLGKQIS